MPPLSTPPAVSASDPAAAGPIGADSASAEKFSLMIDCARLPGHDRRLTDPFVVVYASQDRLLGHQLLNKTEVGRTEVQPATQNPSFQQALVLEWRFERTQQLHFHVFRADPSLGNGASVPLDRHTEAAVVSCFVEDILSSPGMRRTMQLYRAAEGSPKASLSARGRSKPLRRCGASITVSAEKEPMQNALAVLRLRAKGLATRGGLFAGGRDAFVRLRRSHDTGHGYDHRTHERWHDVRTNVMDDMWDQATPVYRSEVVPNSNNPRWERIQVGVQSLFAGDIEANIIIEVRDWDPGDGSHDVVGFASLSWSELEHLAQSHHPVCLTEPLTKLPCGELFIEEARLVHRPSFLDFVLAGCELNWLVAVDLTKTNGDPANSRSLHWLDPARQSENQYESAIRAVGDTLESYDTDCLVPVFGFGGHFPGLTEEQCHCVNICPGGVPVHRTDGVLEAYADVLSAGDVELHGPTKLAPVLQSATEWAAQAGVAQTAQKYFILLLLTDGGVSDLAETARAIVDAAEGPLSILIVGVGNGSFGRLEHMLVPGCGEGGNGAAAASSGRLGSPLADRGRVVVDTSGRKASREAVQFLPFSAVAGGNPAALAEALLEKVPAQMLQYMEANGIRPGLARELS